MKENPAKDAKQIAAALQCVNIPDGVVDVEFVLDIDWQGYPAANIHVILRDDAATEEWLRCNAAQIRRDIREQFTKFEIEQWPYVAFWSESELADLKSAEEPK